MHFTRRMSVGVETLRLLERMFLVDVLHLKSMKNHCDQQNNSESSFGVI